MLFEGISDPKEGIAEKANPQKTTTWEEEETLPMMSPMRQAYRTMSPSPKPEISNLWDPSHESSMETEPEQMHSSPNTLGT